jgi:hypothetical protein
VGVVGDIHMDGMDREALPEVFSPMAHLPSANAWLIARARSDAGSVANALRRIVQDTDPEIGIVELSTMTNVVGDVWRGCKLVVHSDTARMLGAAPESPGGRSG